MASTGRIKSWICSDCGKENIPRKTCKFCPTGRKPLPAVAAAAAAPNAVQAAHDPVEAPVEVPVEIPEASRTLATRVRQVIERFRVGDMAPFVQLSRALTGEEGGAVLRDPNQLAELFVRCQEAVPAIKRARKAPRVTDQQVMEVVNVLNDIQEGLRRGTRAAALYSLGKRGKSSLGDKLLQSIITELTGLRISRMKFGELFFGGGYGCEDDRKTPSSEYYPILYFAPCSAADFAQRLAAE